MGEVIIKADQIYKTYSNGKRKLEVLSGIDLTVNSGNIITIMGQSGAGKSTLLNILGTLDKPDSGILEINNIKIETLLEDELAELRNRHIGFVFQFHHLLPEFTIHENLLIPRMIAKNSKDNSSEDIIKMLELIGLKDRIGHYPNEISGGERQRVAVMRALVNKPSLVLADEPTGNLDSTTGKEILNLFLELNQEGVTLILVTHEQKIAEQAKRIMQMRDGKIISDTINGVVSC